MVKHSVEHSERVGQQRLDSYLDALASALGHAAREEPFRSYCIGLLLDGDRKSIEPLAARLDPERVQAKHQSLHHFVAQAVWSDAAVLEAVRRYVVPKIERHGPITAWIMDDTGIPKKGRHSVGVARQYSHCWRIPLGVLLRQETHGRRGPCRYGRCQSIQFRRKPSALPGRLSRRAISSFACVTNWV